MFNLGVVANWFWARRRMAQPAKNRGIPVNSRVDAALAGQVGRWPNLNIPAKYQPN